MDSQSDIYAETSLSFIDNAIATSHCVAFRSLIIVKAS